MSDAAVSSLGLEHTEEGRSFVSSRMKWRRSQEGNWGEGRKLAYCSVIAGVTVTDAIVAVALL